MFEGSVGASKKFGIEGQNFLPNDLLTKCLGACNVLRQMYFCRHPRCDRNALDANHPWDNSPLLGNPCFIGGNLRGRNVLAEVHWDPREL